ncbi:GPN-loop GTPase 3 [Diplonema papillatum]|nr:GPN-loop GTPase 3 [Diplonema papillatum]
MGKHCQLVMGPAGSGKSTYCRVMQDHADQLGRTVHVINMDPACEQFSYRASGDVRELITVDEVVDEQLLGPNGGLIFAFEYLLENSVWLDDQVGDYAEDFVILDMPGQIELFTHLPILPRIVALLQNQGYIVAGVYLMDSSVVLADVNKYVASTLSCLSAMLLMEIPHVNILSKMDLTKKIAPVHQLAEYLNCDWERLLADPHRKAEIPERLHSLTASIGNLLDQFPLVSYQPLDVTSLSSVSSCMALIDRVLQFEDDEEGRERKDPEDTAS